MNSIKLSSKAKKEGVQWLIASASTEKEARKLECVFINGVRKLKKEIQK